MISENPLPFFLGNQAVLIRIRATDDLSGIRSIGSRKRCTGALARCESVPETGPG